VHVGGAFRGRGADCGATVAIAGAIVAHSRLPMDCDDDTWVWVDGPTSVLDPGPGPGLVSKQGVIVLPTRLEFGDPVKKVSVKQVHVKQVRMQTVRGRRTKCTQAARRARRRRRDAR
jgi:hypothetical protein